MKILEINKFYYPIRGAQKHFLDVIGLLERNGHDVGVFAMRHQENLPSRFSKYFVSYVGFNESDSTVWQRFIGIGRIFWSFEARRNIKKLLKEWQPDVVHVHNMYHQISPSILVPLKKLGIPIVMTVHDYNLISPDKDRYWESVGRQYWKFLFVRKYSIWKRLLLVARIYLEKCTRVYEKSIDTYIVPSHYVKDVMVKGGIDEQKVIVVPHFVSDFEDTIASEIEKVESKQKFALYFGGVSEEKGVSELVELFDELKIPLVIAGHLWGGYELPKSDYVTYVGPKPKQELQALICDASCVVSGSTLPETFGLIALEAATFGKPFFGLKSGAYTEIVNDGKSGFLVDDYSALKRVLRDFFSGKMTFSAESIRRDVILKYSSEGYYRTVLDIFRKLSLEKRIPEKSS